MYFYCNFSNYFNSYHKTAFQKYTNAFNLKNTLDINDFYNIAKKKNEKCSSLATIESAA